jgi:hydrogenase maturation protein HypF
LTCLLRDRTSISTAVLSGGVFQNARLLSSLHDRLARAGFRVLSPRVLPPNDGSISFGQVVIAAAQLAARAT